jgi:hypothetical protein
MGHLTFPLDAGRRDEDGGGFHRPHRELNRPGFRCFCVSRSRFHHTKSRDPLRNSIEVARCATKLAAAC